MPAIPYKPSAPDAQTVRLTFADGDHEISSWISYEFASDFLTPADSFSFTIGATEEGLDAETKNRLKLGARVRLHVESLVLADGYIDSINITTSRSGGWVYNVRGRDRLGQALDSIAEPSFQLKTGGTLAEFLKRLFGPLGWSDDKHFIIDNTANRNARTGIRGVPMSKGGKKKGPKPLKDFVLHQTKPYNHESIFHFASRVAQRHGLWIWASADGETLIVGKPDFDQEPVFQLRNTLDGTGNVLSSSVAYEMTDQPSMIVADSFSGGGEFGKGRCRAHMKNPYFGVNVDEVVSLLAKVPSGHELLFDLNAPFVKKAANVPTRPMYLHDEESKTQEQLDNFVRREMSLLVRKALSVKYVVEGHGQQVGDRFVAWAPDTVVDVVDEPGEIAEQLYVLGVHYSKQRGGGGTTTNLDLVRLNSIQF